MSATDEAKERKFASEVCVQNTDPLKTPLRSRPFSNDAVGPSGSGKSSILALLQRFYDPADGSITFGGVDSRAIPLEKLRAQMAYVSQEPTLYGGGSIRWNLTLGSNDPDSVTQAQLEQACEQANILDFVRSLPEGFDTDTGLKGEK